MSKNILQERAQFGNFLKSPLVHLRSADFSTFEIKQSSNIYYTNSPIRIKPFSSSCTIVSVLSIISYDVLLISLFHMNHLQSLSPIEWDFMKLLCWCVRFSPIKWSKRLASTKGLFKMSSYRTLKYLWEEIQSDILKSSSTFIQRAVAFSMKGNQVAAWSLIDERIARGSLIRWMILTSDCWSHSFKWEPLSLQWSDGFCQGELCCRAESRHTSYLARAPRAAPV